MARNLGISANRLLRRVRDYAQVKADGHITRDVAQRALELLDVDVRGFDMMDRKLLLSLIEKFQGEFIETFHESPPSEAN